VDRPNARPESTLDNTLDLFIELGADDHQVDFPVLYGSGQDGWLVRDLDKDPHEGLDALFETIIEQVPAPQGGLDAPFLMQISTLAWSDYIGRIGCGRVLQGRLKTRNEFQRIRTRLLDPANPDAGWKIDGVTVERAEHLWVTRGLERVEVDEITAGDIVWIAGPEEIGIGDTFADPALDNAALEPLDIEEPTVSMFFLVNNGPFAGHDGKAITLRQLKERLDRELRVNVALRVEDVGRSDGVKVSGRGELHLAILIEEMRREGLELCVSRPEVILRKGDADETLEPVEQLVVDVPAEYQGTLIEKLARRKGEMVHVENPGSGMVRLEFRIPTRGLIGYRNEFLTDTRGLGIMASRFRGYEQWKGEILLRNRGSVVSMETGPATGYQLENLQQRCVLFIEPMQNVYDGQVVGENSRPEDLSCNPAKRKALTNYRSSTKEQTIQLTVARRLTLEQALEWIAPDELVEVTPGAVRIRKAILDAEQRKRSQRQQMALVG
jgi:GTP-binding protein